MASSASDFWTDIDPKLRTTFATAFGTTIDSLTTSATAHEPLPARLIALETFARAQVATLRASSNNPRAALFALGFAQNLQHKPADAFDSVWAAQLRDSEGDPANPDLAALSNLGWQLMERRQFPAAEALLRATIPLFGDRIGVNSPQVLGSWRALLRTVAGQGRVEEARGLRDRIAPIAASIVDEALRNEEVEELEKESRELGL